MTVWLRWYGLYLAINTSVFTTYSTVSTVCAIVPFRGYLRWGGDGEAVQLEKC
jgi:hypothetical protein